MCLTVDTLVAGNREKDHRTGFTTPPKFTLDSLMSFAMRPQWVFNYFTNKKFELANLKDKVEKGTNIAQSVICLLYTSPSPRDKRQSRMPSSA